MSDNVESKVRHFVTFRYPGAFLAEEIIREIAEPTVDAALAIGIRGAFGFRLWSREDLVRDGTVFQGPAQNHGGEYVWGKVYTPAQIRSEFPNERILIANAESWGPCVRTWRGNWQPFGDGDVLLGKTPDGNGR